MAATQIVAHVVPFPQSVPASKANHRTERPPASFEAALQQGWAVVKDQPTQRRAKIRREGVLSMRKEGIAKTLTVDYQATLRGYRFGTPKFTQPVAEA